MSRSDEHFKELLRRSDDDLKFALRTYTVLLSVASGYDVEFLEGRAAAVEYELERRFFEGIKAKMKQ